MPSRAGSFTVLQGLCPTDSGPTFQRLLLTSKAKSLYVFGAELESDTSAVIPMYSILLLVSAAEPVDGVSRSVHLCLPMTWSVG